MEIISGKPKVTPARYLLLTTRKLFTFYNLYDINILFPENTLFLDVDYIIMKKNPDMHVSYRKL